MNVSIYDNNLITFIDWKRIILDVIYTILFPM